MEHIKKTKVFMNGPSQAIRIPKDFRMDDSVVYIKAVAGGLLIIPKENRFDRMKASLDEFSDDFMSRREQGDYEERVAFE